MADDSDEDVARVKRRRTSISSAAEFGGVVACDNCRGDLTHGIYILCAECSDVKLCLGCFSTGEEINMPPETVHKRNHKYRVMDRVQEPILEESWNAEEELALLEGIRAYGLGNWVDVAEHVGSKGKTKCEAHYLGCYLNAKTSPLPDTTQLADPENYPKEDFDYSEYPGDHELNSRPRKGKTHPAAESAGYMPKRREFATEADPHAEDLLADVEFPADEPEFERKLKMELVKIYNRKLDIRYERRKFLFDKNLLCDYRHYADQGTMRSLLRFNSREDHARLIETTKMRSDEQELREIAGKLQYYRRWGIRSIPEEKAFMKEMKSRNEHPYTGSKGNFGTAVYKSIQGELDQTIGRNYGYAVPNCKKSFNVSSLVSADVLTPREQDVCLELEMLPRQLIQLKFEIMTEAYSKNLTFTKDDALKLYHFGGWKLQVNPD